MSRRASMRMRGSLRGSQGELIIPRDLGVPRSWGPPQGAENHQGFGDPQRAEHPWGAKRSWGTPWEPAGSWGPLRELSVPRGSGVPRSRGPPVSPPRGRGAAGKQEREQHSSSRRVLCPPSPPHYSASTGMGFTCPPTSAGCFLRASAGGRGGGLLGGCLMVSPTCRSSRGFCSMGLHSSPRTAACEGRGGVRGRGGFPPPGGPPAPPQKCPPKPLCAHQQVDAAGDGQADGAQDGGEKETGGDGQAVRQMRGFGGAAGGAAPQPRPRTPLTRRAGWLGRSNSS